MATQRQHRKMRFLRAFERIGTIAGAAKASRISRDAVHDWRRVDESFERAFQNAKKKYTQEPFELVDSTIIFITKVIRPCIPQSIWKSVAAEMAIATANLKHDLKEGGRRCIARIGGTPSGNVAEVSLSPRTFTDVDIRGRDRITSADNL